MQVGDVVTALRGTTTSRAVVERVAGQRLLCRRGDGMKAIMRSGGVVVLRRVRVQHEGQAGTGRAS